MLRFPSTDAPTLLLARSTAWILVSGLALAQGSDDCSSAQAISGVGTFSYSSIGANTDGTTTGDCGQIYQDVWFAWTSPASDSFEISTCGGVSYDSKIAAYDLVACPPGNSALIACNDDSCGLQSTIHVPATAGSVYLLRLGGWQSGDQGSGTFTITQGVTGGCDDPSSGADVIVGDLNGIGVYAATGGIASYSIGTTSCNVGDEELLWVANTRFHPVIGQNMYRLEDGRFEQIGLSWLKHGFTALQQNLCCDCASSGTGSRLGIGCSDPYSANLNGNQGGLGPRFEVNAHTGEFAFPYTGQGQTGNSIYKRIQVDLADLDPALHPDALYFGEGHYVSPDDAEAGNQNNNASYRQFRVGSFNGNTYQLQWNGVTERTKAALQAWQDFEPAVELEYVQVPGEGLFLVGALVTDNGDGTWHYEYAIQNLNSDRSGGSFRVPLAPGTVVTNVDFHDVDYHSGEIWDTTDWTATVSSDSVEWATTSYSVNTDANALRWGTVYNFRFDADVAPTRADTTLGLFKPGFPGAIQVALSAPAGPCNVVTYCEVNPNSVGPGAILGVGGSLSIADETFALNVAGGVPLEPCLFFYGSAQQEVTFGYGTLCVHPGALRYFRFPPMNFDFEGTASHLVDWHVKPAGVGLGTITPGSTWNFQVWYRESQGGVPGFNTSNAASVTFCP